MVILKELLELQNTVTWEEPYYQFLTRKSVISACNVDYRLKRSGPKSGSNMKLYFIFIFYVYRGLASILVLDLHICKSPDDERAG